jgi:hypothetical protein
MFLSDGRAGKAMCLPVNYAACKAKMPCLLHDLSAFRSLLLVDSYLSIAINFHSCESVLYAGDPTLLYQTT